MYILLRSFRTGWLFYTTPTYILSIVKPSAIVLYSAHIPSGKNLIYVVRNKVHHFKNTVPDTK